MIKKSILAAAALFAVMGANATVTGSLGGGFGTFATLSGPAPALNSGGMLSGSVSATITGGAVLISDNASADDVLAGEAFLAAGPTYGSPATVTFSSGVSYVSFFWGSPDTYNTLTINSTVGGPQVFTTASFGISGTGDQTIAQSVQFQATAGLITSLVFASSANSFEAARFSVTPAIPEPETYAMLLAGLGVVGFMARRRKSV